LLKAHNMNTRNYLTNIRAETGGVDSACGFDSAASTGGVDSAVSGAVNSAVSAGGIDPAVSTGKK
jgi:hypothetical protein